MIKFCYLLGNILLNGRLNEIDLRNDIVRKDSSAGIQKIRGEVRFNDNVLIEKDLDVNGSINSIDVNYFCSRIYRPWLMDNNTFIINGNVDFNAPIEFTTINQMPFEELSMNALRHDLNDQQVFGRKIIHKLILNGPTMINGRINQLDIDHIFNHYLSITKDQEIEANFVLKNVRFEDDVHVDRIESKSDIINGININIINGTALRRYGDQIYTGNIYFNGNVDCDLDLNVQWINGIGTNHFMQKKRTQNTFSEEIVFTQDLNVKNSINIVNGKRISDVYVNRILKDAVQQDRSDKNYTIYGRKVFDQIDVFILHTRPLNNVTFSRENLFLKKFDQIINGKTRLVGKVFVNNTMLVDKINGINPNDLQRRLVKKSRENIIQTKVRVKELIVNDAQARSYIDNVNISVLNRFADTMDYLKQLDQHLRHKRSQLNLLQNNLESIGSKLLYYERLSNLTLNDLNIDSDDNVRPLFVSNLFNRNCLFMASKQSNLVGCNQVNVFCTNIYQYLNQSSTILSSWQKLYTFYFPGTMLAMEQVNSIWLLATKIGSNPGQNFHDCLTLNTDVTYDRNQFQIPIWFHSIRYISQSGTFVQKYHPLESSTTIQNIPWNHEGKFLFVAEYSLALMAFNNNLRLIHIGHINQININLLEQQYYFNGQIESVSRYF